MTEKIYAITYECKIEPLYSRTTEFVVGETVDAAIDKLFPNKEEKDSHIVLGSNEFRIHGYKITLEKLV